MWAPAQQGYGEVRPSRVDNGGDPTGIALDIEWSSWGGDEAVGHGRGYYTTGAQPVAEAAEGPLTLVAFDLGNCKGQFAYRAVQWVLPGEEFDPTRYFVDICPDEL